MSVYRTIGPTLVFFFKIVKSFFPIVVAICNLVHDVETTWPMSTAVSWASLIFWKLFPDAVSS